MASEVVMPRLGWSMEEGTLIEWRKQDGDAVRAGEVICIIESDKAENEVESFDAGVLRIPPDSPPPGTKMPVGTLLAYIVRPGEPAPFGAPSGTATRESPAPSSRPAPERAPATAKAAPALPARREGTPAISPRARRVAAELGVTWQTLQGSGRTGRIVERDVRAVAGRERPHPARSSPVRRLIADRMARSAHTAAAVTLTTEADATELVRLRQRLAAEAAGTGGPPPAYTDLVAKLSAVALREHPALNASWAGEEIVQHETVHVGIAVDTERGLIVPVLRDVAGKPLGELAAESAGLTEATRAGTVLPHDLRGATFTITNLGMYDIDAFTPLINLPECAILGLGRIVSRPVVVDEESGAIAVRGMLTLSLTFDHRVVDGAPAARFLQRVKQLVERPSLWVSP